MTTFYDNLEKLGRFFSLSLLYEHKCGIKAINQIYSNEVLKTVTLGEEFLLNAEQLFLGIDGLKDPFSHLFKSIFDSPHYSLMKILHEGKNAVESNYYALQASGRLDMRRGTSKKVSISTFESKKKLVNEDLYEPVIVYKHLDRFFIADGKHRAALCASLGHPIRCISNDHILFDSYFTWIARKMATSNFKTYQKHRSFFQPYLHL